MIIINPKQLTNILDSRKGKGPYNELNPTNAIEFLWKKDRLVKCAYFLYPCEIIKVYRTLIPMITLQKNIFSKYHWFIDWNP